MAESSHQNPLLSNSRPSDTSPHVQLHPLVLLTISDYITRHTIRKLAGPIAGAILGQQNGREITMEVAFAAKLGRREDGEVVLDEAWFKARLEHYKEVYKSPQLDLVGWFTLGSAGPQQCHLPLHAQIHSNYNESAVLLLFQPEAVLGGSMTGGKLPVALYESTWINSDVGSGGMEVEGAQAKALRFQELTYSVETGEAEMISVDFVAKGGGNATAIEETKTTTATEGRGKGKAKEDGANGKADDSYLSSEDEELIAFLTARLNATKMLHSRLHLLSKYLSSLPPSYLTDATLPVARPADTSSQDPVSHPILRSLLSTLSRLPLAVPQSSALDHASSTFSAEALSESSDVALVQLLARLTESISSAKEMGRKSAIVDNARTIASRPGAFPPMNLGGDGYDGLNSPENFGSSGGGGSIMSMLSGRTQS